MKLSWCNKCTKFCARVKNLTSKLSLNFHGGLYQQRILLSCKKGNHHFSIPYTKKLDQISCLKCRSDEKELVKDSMRREEELFNEKLRNDQERMYAEAKLQMDRELLLNNLLRNSNSSCTTTPSCTCWGCSSVRNSNSSNQFSSN